MSASEIRLASQFSLPRHGGDPAAAETRFGKPKDGWLDLSTGINPFPYPVPALPGSAWQNLPDSGTDLALRRAAAQAWGELDADAIVAAPGTQALIEALARLYGPVKVAVLVPTYPGHAEAFAQAGHEIIPCATIEELAVGQIAIVVNPNNPDGREIAPDELRALSVAMAERGGLLIVDEAFVDLTPELSIAAPVASGLLVLRSFGKFFGLAGLRLGFAIGEPDVIRLLREALGLWPVSGPALEIGRIALADHAWASAMRSKLATETARMDVLLTKGGLAILGGTSLFRLAGAPRAWTLFEYLGKRGILVRPFPEQPRWLRFGLPADAAARKRLATALAEWPD
ncbi:MAG TPA: threonine-phosphate decarboxylase CobD [Magnetospirillaceae bacterium]|jgi:cobalamin biosynthetic protein CobC